MPQYELNIRDYLRIFHKRKFVVLATFLVVAAAGFSYLFVQKPSYEASATVKIMERNSIAGLLTEWIIYSPADMMESQAKIIKGFPIMKKVASYMGLIGENTPEREINRVVADLQRRITTETLGRTNIIKITANADDAENSISLANAVASVYVKENLLEKKMRASTARKFIEEQLTQLEKRLEKGETQLRLFDREEQNAKLAEPLHKKLVDLEFQLAAFLQKYTEDHPQVIQLREQIKGLESQVKKFSGQDSQYARIVREVEVNKKLYSMFKEKLEEVRITEAQKVGDVSIVDPAIISHSRLNVQKKTGILVILLMGLLLGVFFAFILEALDTSIGTLEDVEKVIKLSVLGTIPYIPAHYSKGRIFGRFKRGLFRTGVEEKDERRTRLIVHYAPNSPMAEAFRNIRTNLNADPSKKAILVTSAGPQEGKTTVLINLGLTQAQKGLKTLLVSSDLRRPAITKTFGVEGGVGLHEVLTGTANLEDALRDISDFILGDIGLDDIMNTPGIDNIWILPSGHLPLNPAEVLESGRLRGLVKELKEKFDIILLDSPPVLPITDASLLASKVDGIIICYETGKTARDSLKRAKIQLESMGTKILGVVLNRTKPQTGPVLSYPYYHRRYSDKKS